MTGACRCGLLVTVIFLLDECWSIPLPGVKSHLDQNTDSSFFPNQYSVFQDENKFEPTFRDIVPSFSITALEQTVPFDADNTKVKTTQNPLEKLLDKLYGSNNWRKLLEQAGDSPTISTTSLPLLARPTESANAKQTSFHGFYDYEISGNQFNGLSRNQEMTTKKPNPALGKPINAIGSKFMMKVVGTRQHESIEHPNVDSNTHKGTFSEWGPFSKDAGTPSEFLKEQNRGDQPTITMQPPIMSVTQKSQIGVDGVARFDPNRVNTFGGSRPQYFANSGVNSFNPNQVNNEQHMFRPNSAFNAFITQTGSDPNNRQLPTAYDADAINERYMIENVNSMYQGQTGQVTETVFGKEQYGYRFSAYSDAKPQAFDADALNQAMMESNRNMQQQPMSPMFPPASRVQQPTKSSYQPIPEVSREKEATVSSIHKSDNGYHLKSSSPFHYTTTPKPPLSFGFVPGNLFPGRQSFQISEQKSTGEKQEASPPEFLRHIQITTGNDAFNPNMINADPNAYNPNALSWVQTRDAEGAGGQHYEQMDEVTENVTSTAATTNIPTTQYLLHTILPTSINSTSMNSSTEKTSMNKVDANINVGFDPNIVNHNQGQTDFIPGQIAPVFSGYVSNSYIQGQGHSYGNFQNEFNPNNLGKQGAQMTFDIAKLLGLNAETTSNDTDASYTQGTASFNPNVFNNMMTADFGGDSGNSTSYTTGFGSVGAGFDPNAANQGFANVLSSGGFGFSQGSNSSNKSTGYIGGYGGFDPNAANVGFGGGSFGTGSTGTSVGSGYISAFDPNKVNQVAVQNPFDRGDNVTSSGDMTKYLLGIVSRNGFGQSSAYSSSYISAFSPDSVNVAPYDPNKYNQVHVHFDPLDMLSKNPGIDKDTFVAAASAFDPDKINIPNRQQAFSPIAMLSANSGIDSKVLFNLKFDPYAATEGSTSTNVSTSFTGAMQSGEQNSVSSPQSPAGFDPVALMAKLMQNTGIFHPSIGGTGKQSLDASFVSGSKNGSPAQSASSAVTSPSISPSVKSVTSTAQASLQSTVLLSSPTSHLVSSTSVAPTTTMARNGTIG